jgi:hypothetical protein
MFTVYPKTRVEAGGPQVETALTIDDSNLTPEDHKEYEVGGLIVKWQAGKRRKGTIPAAETWVVPKPGTRIARSPEESAKDLSIEALQKILEEKQAELAKPKVIVRPGAKPGHDAKP